MDGAYYVYKIMIDGVCRYVGITNDIKKRQTRHNYLLKTGYDKKLYNKIRDKHNSHTISLEIVKEYDNKLEAARFEAYAILTDWFNKKQLWQAAPKIIKYF